jgi:hypothetical protein
MRVVMGSGTGPHIVNTTHTHAPVLFYGTQAATGGGDKLSSYFLLRSGYSGLVWRVVDVVVGPIIMILSDFDQPKSLLYVYVPSLPFVVNAK